MLERLFPKERDFISVLDRISQCLAESTSELLGAFEQKSNPLAKLSAIEQEVETISRRTISQLHDTFVTPFDRRHLFQLVIQLSDICSLNKIIATKLQAYQPIALPTEALELAVQSGQLCSLLKQMMQKLGKIHQPSGDTLALCLSVYQIRSNANSLFFKGSHRLYQEEQDIKKLMMTKEVLDDLNTLVAKFEGVALLVEEIILEFA